MIIEHASREIFDRDRNRDRIRVRIRIRVPSAYGALLSVTITSVNVWRVEVSSKLRWWSIFMAFLIRPSLIAIGLKFSTYPRPIATSGIPEVSPLVCAAM